MEQPAILVRDLYRSYGRVPILRGVDLTVAAGERLALFGANGAGKTTLIRILATLVRPSAGMVSVAGRRLDAESAELRRHVGVVTHQTYLYGDLTAAENLRFYGRLYGVSDLEGRISALLCQVVFCTIALVTGSIWAKPVWGAWWTWDPRLTTTLVLWLIYVSYLMLRRTLDEPERRARLAAVVGIVGFVDVPLVFMSIRWWRTIHPVVFKVDAIDVDGQMMIALVVSLIAFTLLYIYLLKLRVGLERLEMRVEALQRARD